MIYSACSTTFGAINVMTTFCWSREAVTGDQQAAPSDLRTKIYIVLRPSSGVDGSKKLCPSPSVCPSIRPTRQLDMRPDPISFRLQFSNSVIADGHRSSEPHSLYLLALAIILSTTYDSPFAKKTRDTYRSITWNFSDMSAIAGLFCYQNHWSVTYFSTHLSAMKAETDSYSDVREWRLTMELWALYCDRTHCK